MAEQMKCGYRTHASWLQSREARNQAKQLKSLMYGLMAQSGDGGSRALDDLCNSREMAFVITDLEGSTMQASANAAAFSKVQEIHDTVRPPSPGIPNASLSDITTAELFLNRK